MRVIYMPLTVDRSAEESHASRRALGGTGPGTGGDPASGLRRRSRDSAGHAPQSSVMLTRAHAKTAKYQYGTGAGTYGTGKCASLRCNCHWDAFRSRRETLLSGLLVLLAVRAQAMRTSFLLFHISQHTGIKVHIRVQ